MKVTNQPAMRERAADCRHGVVIHGFGRFSFVAPILPFFLYDGRKTED